LVDVLLTHSYHLFYDPKQVRKMQPYLPLGTLYAAALLRQHGFSVALFDAMLEDPEVGFPAALARYKPRVVVIYEDHFNFLSKMCLTRMRQVAYGMIEAARASGTTVIVNGPDSSDHVEEYLRRGCEYVLLGEAEWTLLELLQTIQHNSGQEPECIPGVTFLRRSAGEVFRTASRPLLRDLDTLPFPARDLVDVEAYRKEWKSVHGYFSMNLVASRGCPYRCNWCARPIYGDSFHVRSAASVAREIKELKELYGADHLWFADDIFGLKQRWMIDLAEAVKAQDASVPFKIQSRVNLISRDVSRALRSSGCTEVWMGVESGSQKVLDAMEKGIRVEHVPSAVDILRQEGIRACFFLQFGYPGETWEDIEETIRLVRHTRPDDIGVSVSYPLPGTRFYERVREDMGEKRNWVDSDDLSVMFKGAYATDFYRALRNALHAEVNGWNAAQVCRNGSDHSKAQPDSSDLAELAQLWELVRLMEKHCRIAEPTLAACDGAG
jgi:anaerobic magnesium-protoporphyrin IX monomethyl ester cyclase